MQTLRSGSKSIRQFCCVVKKENKSQLTIKVTLSDKTGINSHTVPLIVTSSWLLVSILTACCVCAHTTIHLMRCVRPFSLRIRSAFILHCFFLYCFPIWSKLLNYYNSSDFYLFIYFNCQSFLFLFFLLLPLSPRKNSISHEQLRTLSKIMRPSAAPCCYTCLQPCF